MAEQTTITQQHTPGPWGIEQTDCTNWIGPLRADGKVEAIVADTDREGLREDVLIRNDADARLISAAPELFAACKPVLAEAKEREDYMHDTWNPDAHVELTLTISEIRAIHNAVTKAEGR